MLENMVLCLLPSRSFQKKQQLKSVGGGVMVPELRSSLFVTTVSPILSPCFFLSVSRDRDCSGFQRNNYTFLTTRCRAFPASCVWIILFTTSIQYLMV